jgi:hypothetical protein
MNTNIVDYKKYCMLYQGQSDFTYIKKQYHPLCFK